VKAKSAKHQSAIASEVKHVSMARMDMAVPLAVARVSLAEQPSSRGAHWPKNRLRKTMRVVAIFILAKARFAASLPAIARGDKSLSQAQIGMVVRLASAKELLAKHPAALHVPKPNGSKRDSTQGNATLSLVQEPYAKHPLASVRSDRSLKRAKIGMDARLADAQVRLVPQIGLALDTQLSANRAQWPRRSHGAKMGKVAALVGAQARFALHPNVIASRGRSLREGKIPQDARHAGVQAPNHLTLTRRMARRARTTTRRTARRASMTTTSMTARRASMTTTSMTARRVRKARKADLENTT